MAVSNPSIAFDNATQASFRAWGLAVSTALQAVGLVLTADTGQINWTTVTFTPGSNGFLAGYEIYRLNDSLQSTKPVFMKIEYGNSNVTSANQPAMWISFSNATNGAGTLIGLLTNARKQHYGAGSSTPQPCYFAGDGSFLTMMLSPFLYNSNGSGFFHLFLAFDRTRDATNTITTDGFHYLSTHPGASNSVSTYNAVPFSNSNLGVNTRFSAGVFSFKINGRGEVGELSGTSNTYQGATFFQVPVSIGTTSYLGDVTYFPQLITAPTLSYGSVLLAGYTNDLPAGLTTITVPVLGATRTYIIVNLDFSALGTGIIRTLARYE